MAELTIFGIIIAIAYFLFVKGYLWKLLILIFGFFGLHLFLDKYLPESNSTLLIILNHEISWAIVVPAILVILVLATSKFSISNK